MIVTTPDLIRAIGEALYGPRFGVELAAALGVNRKAVQRWVNGSDIPSSDRWDTLLDLVYERRGELGSLAQRLRERLEKHSAG